MTLELVIGPMFAGKSSAIHCIVKRHMALQWNVCVVTSSLDTRYSSEPSIVSHDKLMLPAIAASYLLSVVETDSYKQSRLVVIEEAQFFSDLLVFVLRAVEEDGKHVVVVGLDGDSDRRPFGQILDILPLADRVTKLTAFCKECADTTPALFTFDALPKGAQIQVGGVERYSALCRKHYLAGSLNTSKN